MENLGECRANKDTNAGATTQRIWQYELLRIVSCFAVIVLHISAIVLLYHPIESSWWCIAAFYNSCVRSAVPIFIMISGMFFLNPKKEISIGKLYSKYIAHIAIALAFWSVIHAVYPLWRATDFAWIPFLKKILLGEIHLWFCYCLIGLYVLSPIIKKIVGDQKVTSYFLKIWFVFLILIPTLFAIFPHHSLEIWVKKFQIQIPLFVGYYVAGYYFSTHSIRPKFEYCIYVSGILSVLALFFLTWYTSVQTGKLVVTFQEYHSFFVMSPALAIFVGISKRSGSWTLRPWMEKGIVNLAKLTFGIYLVHTLFFSSFVSLLFAHSPLYTIPACSIFTFCCSALLIGVLRQVPLFRKWLT